MRRVMGALFVASVIGAATAWGQQGGREPHIGYLYPAGGQSGTTFEIIAGGQNLRGAKGELVVSGDGIHATAVEYYRALRNLNGDQRRELQRRMIAARDTRLAEQSGKEPKPAVEPQIQPASENAAANGKDPGALPRHPLLDRIDDMSLRELENLQYLLVNMRKRQLNPQIGEMVRIEVTIQPQAAPGPREIRLKTAGGISNPMRFEVSAVPEVEELEPNGPRSNSQLPAPAPLELPVMLNGQILPGDVDRFAVRAKKGQQLVIQAHARSLVPYLADAVPGWFQAVLALYDTKGNEIAFADDFHFDPDPVMLYTVLRNGVYEVEIRDSIFRGREDFVYRLSIGEQPFITAMFPLGGRTGERAVASLDGWNLPKNRMTLNTDYGAGEVRTVALADGRNLSNSVPYAVDKLPECMETESNNTLDKAQVIDLPRLVNGRIDEPGDVDLFKIQGKAGERLVAEAHGRRLRSPIDSLVRVLDADGNLVALNDDFVDKGKDFLYRLGGLLTHDADSYLEMEFPADGVYYVQMADAQCRGGSAYAYRLRLSPPQPDFALRMTPASLNIAAGLAAPICVHALRQDGFDGEIRISLKDAPAGFTLSGGTIPAGKDSVRMTLSAAAQAPKEPVVLQIEGHASIGHREVRHPVTPADDMMQAFLYRHLAPAEEFMVAVTGNRQRPGRVALMDAGTLRIPAGGKAEVRVRAPKTPMLKNVALELNAPPEGMALENLEVVPEGLAFTLQTDSNAVDTGLTDNLIVEAFMERPVGKGPTQTMQRVSLGVLPAIPFEIVTR